MDGSFQPSPQRTIANDDQLTAGAARGGPIDHRPPGAKQGGHALPGISRATEMQRSTCARLPSGGRKRSMSTGGPAAAIAGARLD